MIRVSIANTGKIYVTINDDGPIRIRMVGIEPIRINAFNYPPEIDALSNGTFPVIDVNVKPLKSDANGGSVSAADYDWFKGVYSSLVDGSVISWIKGLVNQVKLLTNRVGLLENNYILKYVVPVDTTAIDLTTDKYGNAINFVEGDEIIVKIQVKRFTGDLANRLNLRLNNNQAINYIQHNTGLLNYLYTAGSAYLYQYTTMHIRIIGTEVQGEMHAHFKTSALVESSQEYSFHTEGANLLAITSLNFFRALTSSLIPTGSIIIIKKR